jgi:S-adenosylmethionine-diacylgycerolhomoserine-N-methlytransferase
MRRLETLRGDCAVLWQMFRGLPRSGTHAENLQAFYGSQALHYDTFREHLLHGRRELIERLPIPANGHVVEFGAGTGRNLEFFGARLDGFGRVDLVDLCPALLARARERWKTHDHVRIIEADATTYRTTDAVDCVYFSYALTMIPQWRAAITNALALLKPGGILGVVDFYHSAAEPAPGLVNHNPVTRAFWKHWFAHDGVHLNPDHLTTLRKCLPRHELAENRAKVPYLPVARVPYYVFVGHAD